MSRVRLLPPRVELVEQPGGPAPPGYDHAPHNREQRRCMARWLRVFHGSGLPSGACRSWDAPTCAAVGSMSLSWWLEEVRARRAANPAIREPRCTSWRLADVQAYWARRSAPEEAGAHVGGQTVARAKKASEAAQAKRDAVREVAK